MKKNILILAVTALVAVSSLTSCKKGENDPFLSLKSRKGRLTGEWKLTSGELVETSTTGSTTTTETTTYTETKATYKTGSFSITYNYTQNITFEKDRTMKIVVDNDGDKTTVDGQWYWIGKNKNLELKNKEAVGFTITSVTDDNGDTDNYDGVEADGMYVIDQLKNKELIITVSTEYTYDNGDKETETATYTYTKQ